jgi:hypothetical protein
VADIDRYDLRHLEDIRRALSDAKPQMVIHLAVRVGGICLTRYLITPGYQRLLCYFFDEPSII